MFLLALFNAAAATVIVFAWYRAAGADTARMGPLNFAILAMVVAGATNATWLMRSRRLVGERRRAWLVDLTGSEPPARVRRGVVRPVRITAQTHAGPVTDEVLVIAADGATRYHRSDCPLIADRPVMSVHRDIAASAGQTSCGMCRA